MKRTLFLLTALALTACLAPMESSPDLYSDAQNSRATADAAIREAEYQERFLTATAQAPIVNITETAAALEVQQQLWTATAVSAQETQMASMTQTAISWTPTPNATSTAVFMQQAAEGTAIANNTTRDNLDLQRQEYTNQFWAILPGVVFAFLAIVTVLSLTWITRLLRFRPAQVDDRGNVLPIMNVVDGTVTDVDRNPNYRGLLADKSLVQRWIEARLQLPAPVPGITAERQDAATLRDQLTDLASRGLPGGQKPEAKRLATQQMMARLPMADSMNDGRFRILSSDDNLDVIDGEIIQVLDADWRKANE